MLFSKLLEILILKHISRVPPVKADVLRIPKMYKIRWFRGFEQELWLLKVGRL